MARERVLICVAKLSSITIRDPLILWSPDDHARASSISHVVIRERFLKSRWLLRSLLGILLGQDPNDLKISDKGGKPRLANRDGPHFSLSRSDDWVAIAIGPVPVGIDVEVVKAGGFDPDVADTFFHPIEIERINACDEPERSAAFYNYWTQKEAYVKGLGAGLSIDLTRVIVQPGGGSVTTLTEDGSADPWHTHVLDAGEDVVLALATPLADPKIEWVASPVR